MEEKAPSNGPDWRQGKSDPDPVNPGGHGGAQGMRVQQGTRPYIRALGPLAIACMARDAGMPIEVQSEYLPKELLEFGWVGEVDA